VKKLRTTGTVETNGETVVIQRWLPDQSANALLATKTSGDHTITVIEWIEVIVGKTETTGLQPALRSRINLRRR